MMPDIIKLIDLGGTVVIAVMALWSIVQILKLKKNGNGVKIVLKAIENLEGNHLGEVNTKLDDLKENQREMTDKLDEIIKLLIQIKSKK